MVFAVDGSVTVDNFRAQVGDSFIITEDGYEPITDHPKSIEDVIIWIQYHLSFHKIAKIMGR